MKIGKMEFNKKKIIICGSITLAVIISAGVIFACNANKNSEVKAEETKIAQTQEVAEENKDQIATEIQQNNDVNTEVKDSNVTSKDKKENVKETKNNTSKNNEQKPVMPEIKTDLKVDGDQVVFCANEKDSSSKTILTFSGDKLSKMVVEMNSSNGKIVSESKEFYEKSGFKVLESNANSLKVEANGEFVEGMNQLGKKQDIVNFYKQISEASKG